MNAHPYTVVAAVDTSDFADLVLQHALERAAERESADVHVLGVIELTRRPRARDHRHDTELEELEQRRRARVEQALETLDPQGPGSLRVRVHARLGAPHEQILELAAECRADLVVVGRHGAGGKRTGSVPALVLADARCPVWVLSPVDYGDPAEVEEACADCAAARRDSSGERWFCDQHTNGYTWRSSRLTGDLALRDQGIWF